MPEPLPMLAPTAVPPAGSPLSPALSPTKVVFSKFERPKLAAFDQVSDVALRTVPALSKGPRREGWWSRRFHLFKPANPGLAELLAEPETPLGERWLGWHYGDP